MLSTEYRLRMEFICNRIAEQQDVQVEDMIWAQKLAKANGSAGEMLRKARRKATNPDMPKGGLDAFMNAMDLGDPDPSNQIGLGSDEEIAAWLRHDKPDDWRQRD